MIYLYIKSKVEHIYILPNTPNENAILDAFE